MGALIVVGDGPEVLNICSGGFLLDAAFSPQRLSELAKMDGAIILASDASRIARANVHLVPNPNVPTSETGTRHRTAERVARSIDVPVISVSEDMASSPSTSRDEKHPLEPIPRLLEPGQPGAADPRALQGPPRRGVGVAVGARGRGPRHRARRRRVLQRAEMVRRIAEEIEGYIVELGADGRLVRLQLEELHRRRRGRPPARGRATTSTRPTTWHARRGHGRARPSSTPTSCSTCEPVAAGAAPRRARSRPRRRRCSRAATACCRKIPRLPEPVIEHIVERFGSLQKIMRATIDDLDEVEGVGDARARAIKDGLSRLAETQHPRPLHLTDRLAQPSEMSTTCASNCLRARRPSWSGRRTEPSLGVVIAPDIMGLRPLFDDLCRVARRAAELGGRAPSSRSRAAIARRRRRALRRRSTTLDDDRLLGDLVAAADATECANGRAPRVLHGRHVHAEGRGHRPVRPRRRVLRDDPRARGVAGSGTAEPLDELADPLSTPTLAIFGEHDPYTPPADVDAPSSARGVTVVRYPRPSTASCTIPTGRPTAPTTPPTPGGERSRSCRADRSVSAPAAPARSRLMMR